MVAALVVGVRDERDSPPAKPEGAGGVVSQLDVRTDSHRC